MSFELVKWIIITKKGNDCFKNGCFLSSRISNKSLFIICQVNNCRHRLWWRLKLPWPIEIAFTYFYLEHCVFRPSLSSSSAAAADKLPSFSSAVIGVMTINAMPRSASPIVLLINVFLFFIFLFPFISIHMMERMCVHTNVCKSSLRMISFSFLLLSFLPLFDSPILVICWLYALTSNSEFTQSLCSCILSHSLTRSDWLGWCVCVRMRIVIDIDIRATVVQAKLAK